MSSAWRTGNCLQLNPVTFNMKCKQEHSEVFPMISNLPLGVMKMHPKISHFFLSGTILEAMWNWRGGFLICVSTAVLLMTFQDAPSTKLILFWRSSQKRVKGDTLGLGCSEKRMRRHQVRKILPFLWPPYRYRFALKLERKNVGRIRHLAPVSLQEKRIWNKKKKKRKMMKQCRKCHPLLKLSGADAYQFSWHIVQTMELQNLLSQ